MPWSVNISVTDKIYIAPSLAHLLGLPQKSSRTKRTYKHFFLCYTAYVTIKGTPSLSPFNICPYIYKLGHKMEWFSLGVKLAASFVCFFFIFFKHLHGHHAVAGTITFWTRRVGRIFDSTPR